jgi:hypothetical protein
MAVDIYTCVRHGTTHHSYVEDADGIVATCLKCSLVNEIPLDADGYAV